MIKKLFFILIFIISVIKALSFFLTDCADYPLTPKITLYSSFGKLKINEEKNTKQITEISKKLNIHENNYLLSGLTTSNIKLNVITKTSGFLSKNNKICIIPENIDIYLTIDSPTIYISKDIKSNSCEYNLTKYHEITHHLINIKTFEYYLPLFKIAAEKTIKQIPATIISNPNNINEATTNLSKQYSKQLSIFVNFINQEMQKQQKFLDSKENYEFETKICN